MSKYDSVDQIIEQSSWSYELKVLRDIINETALEERIKWNLPCYTIDNKNILIVQTFKNYFGFTLFKGILIEDSFGMLETIGNSYGDRQIKFYSLADVVHKKEEILYYINEAIKNEKAGLKLEIRNKKELEMCVELEAVLATDLAFNEAFYKLTPGRQRGYIHHIGKAKQSKTKYARIEANRERIFDGKGLLDCVCGHSKRMPSCDGSHKNV